MTGADRAEPRMGVSSLQMSGARPKVRGQWGHNVRPDMSDQWGHSAGPQFSDQWGDYPYYPSGQKMTNKYGGKNQERRMLRERQREREMRRPNQAYLNSTFDLDDHDIEYISA
ncbi:unnamed protein product [Lymnaea stagnalis]|uniref:Uncharacterized protein n=1 Tax=Lymnaea stagnalis TaxID=6523 RepID=A0AAV2H8J3_LYMST